MFWWHKIKALRQKIMSLELEKDNYKSLFNSLSDTCDSHTEYIAELQEKIKDLKGNPPKIEPPPKYKEDLQGEIYQEIFKHGYASLMFEKEGDLEGIEELVTSFMVLKNIKPFKPEPIYPLYNNQLYQMAQAQGLANVAYARGYAAQRPTNGLLGGLF